MPKEQADLSLLATGTRVILAYAKDDEREYCVWKVVDDDHVILEYDGAENGPPGNMIVAERGNEPNFWWLCSEEFTFHDVNPCRLVTNNALFSDTNPMVMTATQFHLDYENAGDNRAEFAGVVSEYIADWSKHDAYKFADQLAALGDDKLAELVDKLWNRGFTGEAANDADID